MPSYRAANGLLVAATSVAVPKPTGTLATDVMVIGVMAYAAAGVGDVTPPSGWTIIGAQQSNAGLIKTAWFSRTADGGEGSTFTFTATSAEFMLGLSTTVMGTYPVLTASNVSRAGSAATHVAGAVTTLRGNALLLTQFYSETFGGTWTPPTGQTEYVDTVGGEMNYQAQAAAGSSGTKTATPSASVPAAFINLSIEDTGFGSALSDHHSQLVRA